MGKFRVGMIKHWKPIQWTRDPGNPVLRPLEEGAVDRPRMMNPFCVRVGDQYRLYYAGGDGAGHQRISMATAEVDEVENWTRHGPILDLGQPGAFDAYWCVLPCVHRFNGRWHLYYTGNDGSDSGLQAFCGIGLATSEDGFNWKRYSKEPVITGELHPAFPNNRGIAGGGSILEDRSPDGSIRYRMYYSLLVGTKSEDLFVDQEKHCAVCHSRDGVHWEDHRIILSPREDVSTENVGTTAPFVWREGERYRMLYCGIGTEFDFYSISEAISEDGTNWVRPDGKTQLALGPDPQHPWERNMVEYPNVLREGDGLRLFYCGNDFGGTGIGTAAGRLELDP